MTTPIQPPRIGRSTPPVGAGKQNYGYSTGLESTQIYNVRPQAPTPNVLASGTTDTGWEDLTGQAGSMDKEALDAISQGKTALQGAESGLAKANIIGSIINTGVQTAAQIATGVQTKRAREAEYQKGLDEIFKNKREMERQQREAERNYQLQRQIERGALDFEMFKRDLNKGLQRQQRLNETMVSLKQKADEDESFKDAIRQLRQTGGQ